MFEFNEQSQKEPKKREYEESEELKLLAEKIITQEKIDIRPAKVAYLIVSPNISKTVPGKTLKTSPEFKFFSGYDYVIEISADLWAALDDADRYIFIHPKSAHGVLIELYEPAGRTG